MILNLQNDIPNYTQKVNEAKYYYEKNQVAIRSSTAEYLTYVASVGEETYNVEVRYEEENIWLTQKMLGVLFNVEAHTINYHIKKIFKDSELLEISTTRKFRIVQNEGDRTINREIIHYNLQMIIAIGFKVNSERAVQFRRVYEECKSNDVRTEYVLSREGFSFIFIRDVVNGVVNDVANKEMSKDEQLVLRLLKENPNLTASKIAELINKNSRTIQRITNELKNKNLIERIGGTRGYWKVID